jgi:hypothetical protein
MRIERSRYQVHFTLAYETDHGVSAPCLSVAMIELIEANQPRVYEGRTEVAFLQHRVAPAATLSEVCVTAYYPTHLEFPIESLDSFHNCFLRVQLAQSRSNDATDANHAHS